jgi:hypothetical protein
LHDKPRLVEFSFSKHPSGPDEPIATSFVAMSINHAKTPRLVFRREENLQTPSSRSIDDDRNCQNPSSRGSHKQTSTDQVFVRAK